MIFWHWFAGLLFVRICSANLENWPVLSDQNDDAVRTQRDISGDIPLDQLNSFGASPNRLIFDVEGYSSGALPLVRNLLDVKVSTLIIDLYWNEFVQRWQLCPAPFPNNSTGNLTELVNLSWNGHSYRCAPGFTPADLMGTVALYIKDSNVRLDANVVQLMFSLKSIHYDQTNSNSTNFYRTNYSLTSHASIPAGYASTDENYLLQGSSSLMYSLNGLGSSLFTPGDLDLFELNTNFTSDFYSSKYPTQDVFLFTLFKRAVGIIIESELRNSSLSYNISSQDTQMLFFPQSDEFVPWVQNISNNTLLEECDQRESSPYNSLAFSFLAGISQFRVAIDNNDTVFTNDTMHRYAQCGFTPVLNSSRYGITSANSSDSYVGTIINNFIPNSYWAWAQNQPDEGKSFNISASSGSSLAKEGTPAKRDDDDDGNGWELKSQSQFAFQCITMTLSGWTVNNCYDKYRVACQKDSDPFSWTISDSIRMYFEAPFGHCPTNYSFGLPKLSVEQLALLNFLALENILFPVWIDLNDITVAGCYVTGGPYATCPYTTVATTSNIIKRIAPSLVVALVIILLFFFEKWFLTTPIHSNRRRYWKKTINQYYKENDYEGVPS